MEKASSLEAFWLFKSPEWTSFKSMQMSFLLFRVPEIYSNDVSSGNLNSQKDHEDHSKEQYILHFVLKCTKHFKYVKPK